MLFSFILVMLVDGKQFPGSTFYVDTYNTLRSIAGNASRFTEFKPVLFTNSSFSFTGTVYVVL